MIRLNLPTGEPITLKPTPAGKFTGMRIPGSVLYQAEKPGYNVSVHVFKRPLYTVSLRSFLCDQPTQVITTEESNWLKMEIPLFGGLRTRAKGNEVINLWPGQYHLSNKEVFGLDFGASLVTYFTIHVSKELLAGLGSDTPIVPTGPLQAPLDLIEMVHDILKSPFQGNVQDFYFANRVRDILFAHATREPVLLPGELSASQIALMHEADRIMAHNLDGKITIPELARRLGTNFVTLKRNYEKVFGIGLFPRLMQRKMEHIQLLLAKTNKPLKEIADLAGYQTLPGFINAFRKRFKVTPKEWRNERRGYKNTG